MTPNPTPTSAPAAAAPAAPRIPDAPPSRSDSRSPARSEPAKSGARGSGLARRLARGLPPGLLRLLLTDPRFALAVGGFLALGVVGAALGVRFLRVTPESASEIRINGWDWIQARRNARAAAAAEAAGDWPAAMRLWRASLESNPADTSSLRGALGAVQHVPPPGAEAMDDTVEAAYWLLRLAGTNQADLSLAVVALGRLELDEHVLALGEGAAPVLDPAAAAELAAAEFRQDRMERFAALWGSRSGELERTPEAAVYHAGWLAGWGAPADRESGRKALEAAQTSPDPQVARTARRVGLRVAFLNLDADAYRAHLAWLADRRLDRTRDHVNLWRLLVNRGRRAEALDLAREFGRPAESAADLVALTQAQADLGLTAEALARFKLDRARFAHAPSVWAAMARLQMKLKAWDELRALAVEIRDSPSRSRLEGYSQFLSGAADVGANRRESAKDQFAAAAASRIWDSPLALESAGRMRDFGYPQQADALLTRIEDGFTNRVELWADLTRTAFALQDPTAMTLAAERAWKWNPDARSANAYAAALIIQRETPQKALEVLEPSLAKDPENPVFRMNKAMALIQLGRLDAAADLLKSVDRAKLPAAAAASLDYAWAEWRLTSGDAPGAREAIAKVNGALLLAPQRRWFSDRLAKLEAGAGAPAR